MQPDTDTTASADTDRPAADAATPESATTDGATVAVDTDGPSAGTDGTYVPPMLYCVFGLPIFLTLIWFFLRFTRPDRFGRVDRDQADATPEDDDPSDESGGETEGDIAEESVIDEDDELPPAG